MIAQPQLTSVAEPHVLRFNAYRACDENPDEPLTLEAFYHRCVLPEIGHLGKRTLKEDLTALRKWKQATGDPDIRDVTREHLVLLKEFTQELGNGPPTINKTWRELKMIFEVARYEGLISKVPRIGIRMGCKLVREASKNQRETITDAEVAQLLEACKHATYPQPCTIPTPRKHQVAIFLFWMYGPRTLDLFKGLTWENVKFKDRLLKFEAMKTRKLQGLPLTNLAIKILRTIRGRSQRVFSGFNSPGSHLKKKNVWKPGYYTSWRNEILPAAGIDPPIQYKNFRETMVTRYNGIEPGLGNWIAGHYMPGVSAQSYDLPTKRIRDAIESTPVPDCFLELAD